MDAEQSTATPEGPVDNVSTTETVAEPEKSTDETLGDAGKKALSAERDARKEAEKRYGDIESKYKELEAEVSRLRRTNAAAKGTDLEALKEEMRAEYAGQISETSLRAEAKGRLINPADVTLYISAAELAGKDEDAYKSAVDTLLEERPYLAAKTDEKPHWGDVGGGKRDTGESEPRSAVDRMARAYGRAK